MLYIFKNKHISAKFKLKIKQGVITGIVKERSHMLHVWLLWKERGKEDILGSQIAVPAAEQSSAFRNIMS